MKKNEQPEFENVWSETEWKDKEERMEGIIDNKKRIENKDWEQNEQSIMNEIVAVSQ